MRQVLIVVAAFALTAPSIAQEPEKTTLEWVTTKSVVMKVAGMDIPVTYTPDGKLSAAEGRVSGKWWIEGEQLCSTNNMESGTNCILYPRGKKPGDEFQVMSPQGEVTILINK